MHTERLTLLIYRSTNSPVWFKNIQCDDINTPHILRCHTNATSSGERNSSTVCGPNNYRLLVNCGKYLSCSFLLIKVVNFTGLFILLAILWLSAVYNVSRKIFELKSLALGMHLLTQARLVIPRVSYINCNFNP